MCRSIKQLREGDVPAPVDEIDAAALQFVRKISGFTKPASHNVVVFDKAVAEISRASKELLESLEIRGARARSLTPSEQH
jgi:hypothetical protein